MEPDETEADAIFRWRNDEIVLIGERRGSEWVLVRGWLDGDRLHTVRTWTFPTSDLLLGQIRRLVRGSEGSDQTAIAAVADARRWLLALSGNNKGRPIEDAP